MARDARDSSVWVVRGAAVLLALSSAWVLAAIMREDGLPRSYSPFARALLVTALFQVGLFWAPSARGKQRLFAAILMIPSALIFGGLAGEAAIRVARGYPLNPLATITWVAGLIVYGWQLRALARRRADSRGQPAG